MTHSLADLMLAQLNSAVPPTFPDKPTNPPDQADSVTASPPSDGSLPAQTNVIVKRIPLSALRIDHHQPRNYLPADLRAELVHHGNTRSVLQTLIERAAQNDAISAGFLQSIRALARSIADVGLQQPIRVVADEPDTFRIVDGERRFWVFLFLHETAGDARYDAIDAILHDAQASADEVQRAQWAANLCREDIPAVDFAEAVAQMREQFLANLVLDRNRYAAEIGDAGAGKSTPEFALLLTQREVLRVTGRAISERHLYTHLAIADRLKPKAKALARAYQITARQLAGIVRLPEEEQMRLILHMAGISQPVKDKRDDSVVRAGRPTSLQRGIHACVSLKEVLHKLTELNLSRQSPEDLNLLLNELDAANQQIERARRLVQALM
jgi:ParB-like chromosome segregation protein Spo0J